MGFLDSIPDAIKSFGFEQPTVLCAGVLLIDLDSLRKYGYSKIINDFINNNRDKLVQQDQTIINVVFQDKIAPYLQNMECGLLIIGKMQEDIIIDNGLI